MPALVGAATVAAAGVAMWRAPSPWTLALDAGMSFLGQTVPAFRTWAAGRIPEWTDLLWGGFPLLAEPTTAALYPPHAIPYVLTRHAPLRFFDVALALHAGLLAAGSSMLLRELGARRGAVVLAGVLAVASAAGHGNAVANVAGYAALAWLPWVLVAAERLTQPATPRVGGAMLLGWIALAASVLVGMPEHAVYAGALAAIWMLLRRSALGVGERLVRVALLALGAIATCAPQLLATFFYVPATTRSGAAPAAELASLWLADPLALLLPGRSRALTAFVGVALLGLVAAALVARRAGALLLLGFAVVTFGLALGPQLGAYAWLQTIPPFDRFRAPVKLYGITEYAAVWAAALGFDALVRQPAAAVRALGVALAVLALVERAAYLAIDELPFFARIYAGAPRPDLLDRLRAVTSRRPPPGEPPPLVYDLGPPLGGGIAGSLGALVGVASLHPGGVALLPRPHAELLYGPVPGPALQLFGVRYALVPLALCARVTGRLQWRLLDANRGFCIVENPAAPAAFGPLPPATAVDAVDAMLELVRTKPAGPVPVVAPAISTDGPRPAVVRTLAYAPGRIRLATASAAPAWLLVRQSLVPGWTAEIGGAPVALHPAAGLYFALPLPAGAHEVVLTYRAAGLRPGLAVTAAWWLGAAAWLAWPLRRARTV